MPSDDHRQHDPLQVAIEVELVRFHRVVALCWVLLFGVATVGCAVVGLTVSMPFGLTSGAIALAYFSFFSVLAHRLGGDSLGGAYLLVSEVVEATIPWTFMVAFVATQGVSYALSSWVSPMLFCMLIFMQSIRLRRWSPIAVGVTGFVSFASLYFFFMYGRLEPRFAEELVYQPGMQMSRATTLVLCGALGTFASHYLRRVISRAGSTVRQQELFGKYRLVRPIASGGMGEVFEALYCPEGGFERRVAVKRIHAHLSGRDKFVQLFREEAELSSRIAHPCIVQVLDFGRVGTSYFLAMEYVDGLTLSQVMRTTSKDERLLPPAVVGHVIRDLLSALHHAHEVARDPDGLPLRVIHRDVCPQNVLISRIGQVKLTDFGVARALRDSQASETQTVVGHAAYMAPEQARAMRFDVRVDLFAVGVVAWELLSGRRLFRRESEAASVLAVVSDEAGAIRERRPELDPAWDDFLARALMKDPDQRFLTAIEMLRALDEIREARSETASTELAELVREQTEEQELIAATPTATLATLPHTTRT